MKKIIFTIAAVLLYIATAFGQGSIEGTVTDAKGKGVANVTITVVGVDGKPFATVNRQPAQLSNAVPIFE